MREIIVAADVPLDLGSTWDLFFGNCLRDYVARSPATLAVEDYVLRPDGTPRYRMVQRTGAFVSDYSLFERPYRTENRVLDSPFGGIYRIEHTPIATGTRVTHRWAITARNPLLRLALPLIRPLLARAIRADLAAVARSVTGRAPSGASHVADRAA